MRLTGQHAVVTGGGTGIGAAIAEVLAREGARVSLLGRNVDRLRQTAGWLTDKGYEGVGFQTTDVTQRSRVRAAFGAARRWNGGRISILVNNAGVAESAPFLKISDEMWRQSIATNLDGVYYCCQEVLHGMIQAQEGRIVTIASTAGLRGFAYTAAYVAAKHGAVGLMRALAAELDGTSITANAICPGFTDTEIVRQAVSRIRRKTGRSEQEARAELASLNPSGRLIAPEEVAALVLDLVLSERNGEAVEIA
ncbi:MAG TPA: SDR family NAD(P)-dependent oxidoreductase [Allosphingosinicella sp.]